jgi:ribosomal protein S18 acetylase RimI-like enzyme
MSAGGQAASRVSTAQEVLTENGVRIRECEKNDAWALAALHLDNLSARLGLALTEAYYKACLESEYHLFVCAEDNGSIVGFVGMVCDRAKVIKLLLTGLLLTGEGLEALAYNLSRPSLLLEYVRHLWRWLRIRGLSRKVNLPRWEYRPVVVAKAYRSRGVAKLLLAAADDVLDCKGVTKVFLQVAKTNVSALKAYERSGFSARLESSSTIFMIKDLTC